MKNNVRIKSFLALFAGFNLFLNAQLSAQTPQDSLAIAHATWKEKTIEKGLSVKTAGMDLFGSRQQISVVTIQPRKHKIRFIQPKGRVKTSEQALSNQAKAAVNAGFFNLQTGGSVNYIKIDEKVYAESSAENFKPNGAIVLKGNKVDVIPWSPEIEKRELERPAYKNVLVSKAILMDEGRTVRIDSTNFAITRHPRSVIGVDKKGNVLFVVIDGRSPGNAEGISLFEAAYLSRQLGMTDALNLDGGGSSTLWIYPDGIINYPSDNKLFDHEGERAVGSVIIVR